MKRYRHFLCAAPLLSAALALFVPAHLALAQQASGKAEVKISELRPIVRAICRTPVAGI